VTVNGPVRYEIRVLGELGEQWTNWFEGMVVVSGAVGTTILRGVLADQAALHGVLARIRDLGLPLLALEYVAEADEPVKRRHMDMLEDPYERVRSSTEHREADCAS
jgi:hypothetical protein